jgi:hypothetical protein
VVSSLDPRTNPLLRLYELFDQPGVAPRDDASNLGVGDLKVKGFGSDRAQELILLLRQTPPGALNRCGLTIAGHLIIDFAQYSITDWFDWEGIEERRARNELCESCYDTLLTFRPRIELYRQDNVWLGDDPVADCLTVLDEITPCQCCGELLTLEVITNKTILVENYLLDTPPDSESAVSAMVWHSPAGMEKSVDTFQDFLEFMHWMAVRPMVLFFYRPTELYKGLYFKILSLDGPPDAVAEREEVLAGQLAKFTPSVFAKFDMLREDLLGESRPDMGERFNLVPSVFLSESGKLASYPSHTLFTQGPLRSLLFYTVLAWLAERTERQPDGTHFTLQLAEEADVVFTISLTDVKRNGASVFGDPKWGHITGLLARDVGQSAGIKIYRDHWLSA